MPARPTPRRIVEVPSTPSAGAGSEQPARERDSRQNGGAEQAMARYAAGDDSAFEEVYACLAAPLRAYLMRLTANPAAADDLLQTAFTKVHRARSTYRVGLPVLPWLKTIAHRCFLDDRRGLAASRERLPFDGILPDCADSGTRADVRAEVHRALGQLPEHYRVAIQLTKLVGLSGEEAAEQLRTTQSAVKLRVHRGISMLRNIFFDSPGAALSSAPLPAAS